MESVKNSRKLVMFSCCFLLINIYVLVGAQDGAHKYVWQTKLLNDLLANYHKGVPPSLNGSPGPAVTVDLRFSLVNFDFIDEANEVATVYGWFYQAWNDPRLMWDPASYNGTDVMKINANDVWLPDIEMFNTGTVVQNLDSDVMVYSTGMVHRVPSVQITFICRMDFKFFPYDNQVCQLKFGSWHYHADVIILTQSIDDIDLSSHERSRNFELTNTSAKRNVMKYECCPEKYIDITYTLHLKRVSSAYSVKLVLPAALTGFLILATFLLPPASYEKITLCGLIFIALLLQLIYLHDIVPASGDTILGDYFAFALFIDFFATIIAAVSYNVHVRSSPKMQQHSSIMMKEMEGDDRDLRMKMPQNQSKIGFLRYLDFVCFVIFGIVFIVGMAIILGRRG
ncbi:acetylcholine receptor subunit alpha-type acr-16-like [Amphiura filiformis]|uniref:acetylcholine receptor subunit alpha-type acr-16-like n=1 Tax=Amphiura filiformis TaxID=82378 RepID=UPI003B221D53